MHRTIQALKPRYTTVVAAAIGFLVGSVFAASMTAGRRPAAVQSPPAILKAASSGSLIDAGTDTGDRAKEKTSDSDRHAVARQYGQAEASRAKGDYVLDSEIPALQQRLDDHVKRRVNKAMELRDGEYKALFATLGIDGVTSAQLRAHIAKIFKARAEADNANSNLVAAKVAYDVRMRKILGSDYEVYRAYEDGDMGRRETHIIGDYVKRTGVDLPAADLEAIQNIVTQNGVYSSGTLNGISGPFGEPYAQSGGFWSADFLASRLDQFRDGATIVLQKARGAGISQNSYLALEQYYRAQIDAAQREVDLVRTKTQISGVKQTDAPGSLGSAKSP